MLNKVCYISDDLRCLESFLEKNSDSPFVLKIEPKIEQFKSAAANLYSKLILNTDETKQFSLCIDLSNAKDRDEEYLSTLNYDDLAQIIFHPSFLLEFGNPIIFYKDSNYCNNSLIALKKNISTRLKAQGYKSIHFLPVTDSNFLEISPTLTNHPENIGVSIENYKSFYYEYYLKKGKHGEFLFCQTYSVENFVYLKRSYEETEKFFHLEAPAFYSVLEQSMLQKKIIQETTVLYNDCQKELINARQYLDILKAHDESKYINRFYYFEYEVLPLWYKQFGHLIKVLMGIRTFRSLFSDSIKKYKN